MPWNNFFLLSKKLFSHFSTKRKYQYGGLLALTLITALFEILNLIVLVSFIGMITNPNNLARLDLVKYVSNFMSFTSEKSMFYLITFGFIGTTLLTGILRTILLYANTILASLVGSDLSQDVFKKTLYQPYKVHINRNSSEIISAITNKVTSSINVLSQLNLLTSSIVLLISIAFTLLSVDPFVSLLSISFFGFSYLFISKYVRKKLHSNGTKIAREQSNVIKIIQEGLGGIREVLLDSTQEIYCHQYRQSDSPLRKARSENLFLSIAPKYMIETLGLIFIATACIILVQKDSNISETLSTLGVLAVGAQRMLPIFQQAYSSWTSIAGDLASLEDIIGYLEQKIEPILETESLKSISFQHKIEFVNVSFSYSQSEKEIINNLSFVIPKGKKIGIIGKTGSGKTTLIDLLLGLLSPTSGKIIIDNEELNLKNARLWQRSVANVPQSIFLIDSSIKDNIAIGVSVEKINFEKVEQAAKLAHLSDYINQLENSFEHIIGERGVRLSGGQKQRIAIARSLYKDAKVLVLDEATSALDTQTEKSIMEAVKNLGPDMTTIIIAHRMSTLKMCDFIIEIENGKIKKQGTFEEITNTL